MIDRIVCVITSSHCNISVHHGIAVGITVFLDVSVHFCVLSVSARSKYVAQIEVAMEIIPKGMVGRR